jgi:hypothetical protein
MQQVHAKIADHPFTFIAPNGRRNGCRKRQLPAWSLIELASRLMELGVAHARNTSTPRVCDTVTHGLGLGDGGCSTAQPVCASAAHHPGRQKMDDY